VSAALESPRQLEALSHLVQRRARVCGCELCERAAIVEYDARLERAEAEREAARAVRSR